MLWWTLIIPGLKKWMLLNFFISYYNQKAKPMMETVNSVWWQTSNSSVGQTDSNPSDTCKTAGCPVIIKAKRGGNSNRWWHVGLKPWPPVSLSGWASPAHSTLMILLPLRLFSCRVHLASCFPSIRPTGGFSLGHPIGTAAPPEMMGLNAQDKCILERLLLTHAFLLSKFHIIKRNRVDG